MFGLLKIDFVVCAEYVSTLPLKYVIHMASAAAVGLRLRGPAASDLAKVVINWGEREARRPRAQPLTIHKFSSVLPRPPARPAARRPGHCLCVCVCPECRVWLWRVWLEGVTSLTCPKAKHRGALEKHR